MSETTADTFTVESIEDRIALHKQQNRFFETDDKQLDALLLRFNDEKQAVLFCNLSYKESRKAYRRWNAGRLSDADYDAECLAISIDVAKRIVKLFKL